MKIDKIKDISILLVEDELELREMIFEYLQIFFSRIFVASKGDEAYEIYKYKKPDIILTDINIPNLNGLDMISKIRKEDATTKIIIMSAHSDQEKLLLAVGMHLESYLIKPIETDAIKKILMKTVDSIRKISSRIYVDDNLFWDNNTNTLWENKQEIELKYRENLVLRLLFSKPNYSFSAEEIFEYLNLEKTEKKFSSHAITSLIKRIRLRVPNHEIIQNLYGSGYRVITI